MKDESIRYFVELSYNGKSFHGWQIQNNAVTVQEILNKALSTILREEINVVGAGRTDTGVHASYFMAHFDIKEAIIDYDLILDKLNKFLPKDIAVYSIRKVKKEAHTRFDALTRTYEYRITNVKNPFLVDFAWYYKVPLDIEKMNKAAEILFSFDDFTSFSKTGTQVATNICKIHYAKWHYYKNLLIFKIKADRFLRNMVRAIVGTLVDVGLGKIDNNKFKDIIEQKNRSLAGTSVPPQGLFLTDIEYPNELFEE